MLQMTYSYDPNFYENILTVKDYHYFLNPISNKTISSNAKDCRGDWMYLSVEQNKFLKQFFCL